ncbi:hypothetical protein L3Q67_25320 [Saccharothrix sp. AJ9571]|nr:hypothetical protein L3Q67_25320 [Saccharothrix sp. AJ9571]
MFARSSVRKRLPVLGAAVLAPIGILIPLAVVLRPEVTVPALSEGATVSPEAVSRMEIATNGNTAEAEVRLDGVPVPFEHGDGWIRLAGPAPAAGPHKVEIEVPGSPSVLPSGAVTRSFTVDVTPPGLVVEPVAAVHAQVPAAVRGQVTEAHSVLVHGKPAQVGPDGRFAAMVPGQVSEVVVEARDGAGNVAAHKVPVAIRHPGMRAVHMSALAWSSPALREPVLRMAAEKLIDTVQLDVKDESGEIGYLSEVPLAKEIQATRDHYDARATVDELHKAGVRVVARVVAFRDPILAEASWGNGNRDRVVQKADGQPWTGGYGKYAFTNFADPSVRQYNVDIAEEAAALGFDDILYDYVRRPDGKLGEMRFPGLKVSPEQSIADFVGETQPKVRAHGAVLGASVFGIAATRPEQIAQDIRLLAKHSDYVAPMVYPSHWGPGEYQVADPESQPFDITQRSLADFERLTAEGDGQTVVIPWLQAFSLKRTYGAEEVRAQIKAAEAVGIKSFLLWNAACKYDAAGLKPG